MDISDITLVAMGGALVAGSSIVIFLVNYRRCRFFIRTPEPIDNSVNPVNPIQSIHAWN